MRLANSIYFVNQFAGLQIKHNYSVVAFRSRKQPARPSGQFRNGRSFLLLGETVGKSGQA